MENLEQYWEQSFSPIGRKFTEIRPNYQDMGETDSMVAALYWLELEMYNGGFLQFFCNWGYDAYLLAIKGLGAINATYTEQLLIQAYGIIQRLENDSQLQELWNIPKHLTENEITKLNKIDEEYWEDKENIMLENPLKVVPLIHSNLTPVKFSHSPFCLFLFSSYSSCPLCRVLH